MKSLIVNHCNSHFKLPSGTTKEMAMDTCKHSLFVYTRNKAIGAKNRKIVNEDDHSPYLTIEDADKDWFSADWYVWKLNFDNVLFTSLRDKQNGDLNGEEETSDHDSEGTDFNLNNDVEDISDCDGNGSSNVSSAINGRVKKTKQKRKVASIIRRSPSRMQQKELEKHRKARYNETAGKNAKKRNEILNAGYDSKDAFAQSFVFKNNLKFLEVIQAGGFKVKDDTQQKLINEVVFGSFMTQNNIVTDNKTVSETNKTIEIEDGSDSDDDSNTEEPYYENMDDDEPEANTNNANNGIHNVTDGLTTDTNNTTNVGDEETDQQGSGEGE